MPEDPQRVRMTSVPPSALGMSPGTRFPDRFLWGAATSAYQIEGSPLADGAGASIWHRFAHTPGMVHGGDTGDVACDHYRRAADDVALMREMGLAAYRLSIAWGRILPTGRGRVNRPGLAFYERLIDLLLASNIQPVVTLYHWDLPAALEDHGGWLNPDSAAWFADYAEVVVRALDDRVRLWVTLNEPWVVADGGYVRGVLAPGHTSLTEAARVAHSLLRAHAAAVDVYRASGRHQIGLVVNLEPQTPASPGESDRAAADRADAYVNRQFLDPVFLGVAPEPLRAVYGDAWADVAIAEMAAIRRPIDFLGVNYYSRSVVRADPAAVPTGAVRVRQPHSAYTDMDWEIYPAGLTDILRWVRDRYGPIPLYVTENGAAFPDPPTVDGAILDDPRRVAYFQSHLAAARTAIAAGVDLRGYFAWSLLDNFEWNYGYAKRFGIVHVDHATQRRTLKASARFYADVIRTHGAIIGRPTG
jgi:beta-glucosidase